MSDPKVTKVTNEQEFDAMQKRIDDCAVTIANPSTSDTDRERYKIMYTEFCRLNQRYLRKRRLILFPGLREVYGILEYEFDEPNDEPLEIEISSEKLVDSEPVVEPIAEPVQENPVEPNYPDWLKD